MEKQRSISRKAGRKCVSKKLQADVNRYKKDFALSSWVKLFFVVDFWPVLLLRLDEYSLHLPPGLSRCLKLINLFFRPLAQGLSGTRIFSGANIGGGLLLHTSPGVAITSMATIGENCTLFSGASVMHKANDKGEGGPIIGNNVRLMSGCKIVGSVVIGDNVFVGANAVVLQDIPANSIAVGIPATIKRKENG